MAKRFIGGGDTDVAPAGSVQAFAGVSAPSGWLLCDGSVKNISDYPKLAAAIGSTWDTFAHPVDGTPTVGVGEFALPNMKGLYLSGSGNSGGDARSLGVFQNEATKPNGLQNSSSTVTVNKNQWNSNQNSHTHFIASNQSGSSTTLNSTNTLDDQRYLVGNETSYTLVGRTAEAVNGISSSSSSTWASANATGTAAGQSITGDAETRPKTAPVNYIIKY